MRRHAWICYLIGISLAILALWGYLRLYPLTNDTAALHLRVSRAEAGARAAAFLAAEGVTLPAGYRRAITFAVDDASLVYLHKTLGLRRSNAVLQTDGFVYTWNVRWFRPETAREFRVQVDPDGRIVGYEDLQPDDVAVAASPDAAGTARAFLQRTAGLDLAGYTPVETGTLPLPGHTETTFTWERPGFRLGAATQRVQVAVAGARVVRYQCGLHLPEAFLHGVDREQAKGDLLAGVALRGALVFMLAGLAALLAGATRRALNWRVTLLPAGLVAGITLLNHVNLLPLAFADFETPNALAAFWLQTGLGILVATLLAFVTTALLVAAAEWLYRWSFPQAAPLLHWFSRDGVGSAAGRMRLGIGYLLVPLQLLFVAVFYYASTRYLHGWGPPQVPYDDLLSTGMPWAYALLVGVEAAVSEEFLFRVVAISWLRRVLKRDWLAVLIPAFIWGFAHTFYAQKPFYIRGIEVTIWGIIFGWIFLRYGPLPSLLAHAAFNALLVGEVFLCSVVPGVRVYFYVVLGLVLLPLILTLALSRRPGAQQPAPANAALPAPPPPPGPAETEEPPYRPLRWPVWAVGLPALILGCGLLVAGFAYSQDQQQYHWPKHAYSLKHGHLSRGEITRRAQAYLTKRQISLPGWIQSTAIAYNELDDEVEGYLQDYLTRNDMDELVDRVATPEFLWTVAWQKPRARERWQVRLKPDGAVWDVQHQLPEEAPGASLSPAGAQALAQAALKRLSIDVGRLTLAGTERQVLPHRTAYTFTWHIAGLRVGKAQFLTRVLVDGDQADTIERTIHVPESYTFERARVSPWRAVGMVLSALLSLALLGLAGAVYYTTLRQQPVAWRRVAGVAVVVGGLLALEAVLVFPLLWALLPDILSPPAFLAELLGEQAVALVIPLTVLVAGVPVLAALWRTQFPNTPGPYYWWNACWRPVRYAAAWRDAVLGQVVPLGLGMLVAGALVLLDSLAAPPVTRIQMPDWLVRTPSPLFTAPLWGMDALSPVLLLLLTSVVGGFMLLFGWLSLVTLAKRLFRRMGWALLAVFMLSALSIVEMGDWEGMLLVGVGAVVSTLALWVAYQLVLRDNPLTLVMSAAGSSLFFGALVLIMDFPAYRVAGIVILLGLLLAGLAALISALSAALAAATPPPAPPQPYYGWQQGWPPYSSYPPAPPPASWETPAPPEPDIEVVLHQEQKEAIPDIDVVLHPAPTADAPAQVRADEPPANGPLG